MLATQSRRALALSVSTLIALGCLAPIPQPLSAEPTYSHVTGDMACTALSGRTVGGAKLTTASIASNGSTPSYCRVSGTIVPALHFELRLPETWNGKLYYGGGGGYDGVMPDLIVPALTQGYAQVVSNGGHEGDGMSASFIENNPRAARLFGSEAVPMVMAEAFQIITAAYGTPPRRSYFEGCSTGGQQALMAVQRHPDLFDGVIARAPGFNWVGFMGQFNGISKALAAPGGAFSPVKAALLAQRVREACDGMDGIRDGIVSNRRACTAKVVKITALRCAGGKDLGDTCFSDAQLRVITTWTSDVRYAKGAYYAKGHSLTGNEDDPSNFGLWASGNGDVQQGGAFVMQDSTLQYYLANDPKADSLRYGPWDRNRKAVNRMARLNDATNPNIWPFIKKGGKLIVWQGGSDAALSVNSTIDYVEKVRRTIGVGNAARSTRFYVAPGVNHCNGGPGADETDLLMALDLWVEQEAAPIALTAKKMGADGYVEFTRPLCQYPAYPRYKGPSNDPDAAKLAANYICAI